RYKADSNLVFGDWAFIITAIGFLIFYIFSLRGSGFQQVHKYLRTFLLLVSTILVLYITCTLIQFQLLIHSEDDFEIPFTCGSIKNSWCYLNNTNLFMALITALFIVIEVGLTLAWGPLEKTHQFGGAQEGYAQNANVILVRPDQPYQQHQQFYHPQQQQAYYAQMQQLQHPPQQPILVGPNATPQQQQLQQQQQQGHNAPLEYLPYTPPAHTQLPVAATATSGYQPSPQPSQLSTAEHKPSSSPYTPAH
ncbi:hypothetical protein BGZ47_004018, partial [Haplosporangium gracile]